MYIHFFKKKKKECLTRPRCAGTSTSLQPLRKLRCENHRSHKLKTTRGSETTISHTHIRTKVTSLGTK